MSFSGQYDNMPQSIWQNVLFKPTCPPLSPLSHLQCPSARKVSGFSLAWKDKHIFMMNFHCSSSLLLSNPNQLIEWKSLKLFGSRRLTIVRGEGATLNSPSETWCCWNLMSRSWLWLGDDSRQSWVESWVVVLAAQVRAIQETDLSEVQRRWWVWSFSMWWISHGCFHRTGLWQNEQSRVRWGVRRRVDHKQYGRGQPPASMENPAPSATS